MHEFLHALTHAVKDTLSLLPWLIVVYVAIELLENKTDLASSKRLQGKGAPLIGAATGLIPQCGFSVMSAKLFEQKYITIGTLFAIFLSTSDEAFIILLSDGVGARYLLPLFVSKIILGALIGYGVDAVLRWTGKAETLRKKPVFDTEKTPTSVHEIFMRGYLEEILSQGGCVSCGKPHDSARPFYTYFILPLLHALKVAVFIFLVNFTLTAIIHSVGDAKFASFMEGNRFLQPFIACAIGLIPNCASSVVLTETFLSGAITFGTCAAGLCANAGMGFVVLLKNTYQWKRNLCLIGMVYLVSICVGILLNIWPLMA